MLLLLGMETSNLWHRMLRWAVRIAMQTAY